MEPVLNQFRPRQRRSMRAQITDAVREMVTAGKLSAGSRLPSTQELAAQWEVTVPTVQMALTPLVKEGLLERTPGVGTFVRRSETGLTRVGIYASSGLWRQPEYAFGRSLCNELHTQLAREQIEEDIWVDPRPEAEQVQPWNELVRAAAERRFQVLIVPTVDLARMTWLEKLSVPAVYLSSANIKNRVTLDGSAWAAAAMQLIAEQGCRRVGVICTVRTPVGISRRHLHDFVLFEKALVDSAARHGLELRPEWIVQPMRDFGSTGTEFQTFGFKAFHRLWSQTEHPDGVIVHEDVTAAGVLMAIMQQQIRVPDQLKLVLHRNAEIGLFCPVPAGFVDIRVADIAAALISQAVKLYSGHEIKAVSVQPHPVPPQAAVAANEPGNNDALAAAAR